LTNCTPRGSWWREEDLAYLQAWDFPDVPTDDALIFVPMGLVERSLGFDPTQQLELLGEIREKYKLPAHHLINFGEVGQYLPSASSFF